MPCLKSRRQRLLECGLRALMPSVLVWAALCCQGCAATQFYERESLNDRAMQFDQDGGVNYVRSKIEAAREGSLGGFGSAEAGGCGCQ
ncbi:MAG: DUF4266 domain-containing protein [Planctomycetes bacterium]|nr:DUF4266 domain-containing protein [Planctomycetota bacterium]